MDEPLPDPPENAGAWRRLRDRQQLARTARRSTGPKVAYFVLPALVLALSAWGAVVEDGASTGREFVGVSLAARIAVAALARFGARSSCGGGRPTRSVSDSTGSRSERAHA